MMSHKKYSDFKSKSHYYPLPPNRQDFLLLKAEFAWKYTQCYSHVIYIHSANSSGNKIQPIKVPSQVYLIDCLVFKQQKSLIFKHHCHYNQFLQRWGSINHHHNLPFRSSQNIQDLLNSLPLQSGTSLMIGPFTKIHFWSGLLNLETLKKREKPTKH